MATEKKSMGLADLIAAEFVGPIALRTVKARRDVYHEAIRLEPVDEASEQQVRDLGIDFPIIFFPVAAFHPPLWTEGNCYLRQRRGIVECIPTGWQVMKPSEWTITPQLTTFALEFVSDERGKISARNPSTGQMILPRKEWTLPEPDKDGKIIIPAGQAEIRPTVSRTFWIAGDPGTLAQISEHQMETYEGNGDEPDFSYAEQFELFGQLYTAFEVCGNPLDGLPIEVDRRHDNPALKFNLAIVVNNINEVTTEFERWMSRELLPLLHPDFLGNRAISEKTRQKIMDIAEMTRNESLRLIGWYNGWAGTILPDMKRRMASNIPPIRLAIPEIVTESGKKEPRKLRHGRLIDLKRSDLERMLFQPKTRSPRTKVVVEKNPAAKTEPAKPATKPAVKAGRTRTIKPPVRGIASIGEVLQNKKQGIKAKEPASPAKKLSNLVPCVCGRSHRRGNFTGKRFKVCPMGRPKKLD